MSNWIPLLVLLAGASTVHAMNSTGRFSLEPQSQVVIEGDTAKFFCQCARDARLELCFWNVNENQLTGGLGIEEDTEGPDNNRTSVLTIPALPKYNGSRVQCVASVAGIGYKSQEAVLTTRGAVDNLALQSSTTTIRLIWKLLSPTNPGYLLRIDVYSQNDVEPVRSDRVFPNQTVYIFSVAHPDPSLEYTVVVTPIFVYGEFGISTNGTSATVTGYFLGVPLLPTNSVQVDVKILVNKQVLLTFSLDNAVSELVTTGHRVDEFSVWVENDEGLGMNCSGTVSSDSLVIDNSTLSFSLPCSDVPVSNHLTAIITATNLAGSTSLTTYFSTSPLENIAIQQCDINTSPECQFVVKFETKVVGRTAAVVLVRTGLSDIHSFVDTFSTYGERGEIAVYGLLPGDHYSVSVLVLYGGELVVVYEGNVSVAPMSSGVPDRRTEYLDEVTVQPRSKCVLVECTFLPDSPATGCGVVLVSLSREAAARFFELQRGNGRNTASECVDVEEEGSVSVIAFAYVNSTLSGRPYIIKDQYLGEAKGGLGNDAITAIVVGVAIVIVLIVGVLVAVGTVYCFRQRRPGRHDDDPAGSSSPNDGNPGGNNDNGSNGDGKKGGVPDRPQYNQNEIVKKEKLDDGREESDSGHGTQTLTPSSDADVLLAMESEDDPPHFHNSVQTREDGDASVISADGGTNTEGGVYKQEESIGDGNYFEALLLTLNMSRDVSVQIQDQDDSLQMDTQAGYSDHEMNMSGLPFLNPRGSEET